MPCHHVGAEAADQQCDHRKDARFREHSDADGQADIDQALDRGPLRPLETAEHFAGFIDHCAPHPASHAQ